MPVLSKSKAKEHSIKECCLEVQYAIKAEHYAFVVVAIYYHLMMNFNMISLLFNCGRLLRYCWCLKQMEVSHYLLLNEGFYLKMLLNHFSVVSMNSRYYSKAHLKRDSMRIYSFKLEWLLQLFQFKYLLKQEIQMQEVPFVVDYFTMVIANNSYSKDYSDYLQLELKTCNSELPSQLSQPYWCAFQSSWHCLNC